jgi:hypothetical protein
MITSSDDGGSSENSSGDEIQTADEDTLRQLRTLQEQVSYACMNDDICRFAFSFLSY